MASHSAELLRAACASYAQEHHCDRSHDRPSQLGHPHCQHESSDTATHLPRHSGRGWKPANITDSTTTPGATDVAYSRRSIAAPPIHHSSCTSGQVISAARYVAVVSLTGCCRVHATQLGFQPELSGKLFRLNGCLTAYPESVLLRVLRVLRLAAHKPRPLHGAVEG